MSGLMKVLTGILGVMAVVACLATVGIIGYSMTGAGAQKNTEKTSSETVEQVQASTVPTQAPLDEEPSQSAEPVQTPRPIGSTDHVHDYEETVVKKATCYSAGKIKYSCECGDEYYVDIMSTGHVAGDWEITRIPTAERDGIRVQKCIYCDDIVAQENIAFVDESNKDENGSGSEGDTEEEQPHIHQYTAETVREPSCILAGLRKYTCSCGNFYTEMIPAPGHVATDWTVAEEPTTTYMGTEQRTCTECGVVLDSRPIPMLSPSPSPSASAAATATGNTQTTARPSATMTVVPTSSGGTQTASPNASATPSATPTAVPTATPHSHQYKSYVLKEANCTEKGIRSFVCNCGSSYAESIERDLNRHTYRSVVIPPTRHTEGRTVYTCIRCNYSYYDNLTPALGQ